MEQQTGLTEMDISCGAATAVSLSILLDLTPQDRPKKFKDGTVAGG
jgi:hypothetical protein